MLSFIRYILLFSGFVLPATLALPNPGQAASALEATPTLPTIVYGIPGILNDSLTLILGKGSDEGIEVGGIGAHSTPNGVIHEHGTGDAQIGPDGIEVCLTQTYVVGVRVVLFLGMLE